MAPKKEKEFKVYSRRQPIYKPFSLLMRLLFRKPKIINLAGEIEDKSIIVANHSAKSGPPGLDLYFPKKTAKWGAHEMFEGYRERKAYLRDILYIKKMGRKPGFATSFKASVMALFNLMVYKGMWMIPTYPDGRLMKTLRYSAQMLDANVPVIVFPENSNEGYKDVLTEFFPGFVMLAEKYFRATKIDLPVYPVYYSVKKRIMVIGAPMYVNKLAQEGLKREQIAQKFCDAVNALYFEYVQEK